MGTLMQDLRFALRSLSKRPAFTAVAVLSLALGIGANTAIFSVIDAVLLRPLPYADPGRLVDLYESAPQVDHGSVAPGNFRDWREQNNGFSQLAAHTSGNVNLQGISNPERLSAEFTSDNVFGLLGVKPTLGRAFVSGEDRPGAPHVAILSDGLWRRRFGADPRILGKTITLSGDPYTVVGVMPSQFRLPATVSRDLWLPLQLSPAQASQRDLVGGVVGLLLAYGGAGALIRIAGSAIPFGNDVGFNPRVFVFLLIVAVATGIIFGLAPALQSTQVDLQIDLKEGGGKGSVGRGRQRLRSLLVIGETALALVLLVGAGLVMRAFVQLENTSTGMGTQHVLTMHLRASTSRVPIRSGAD